jgi:uncharacterized protein (TIGR02001 family)
MKKLVMGLFGVILLAGSVAASAAEVAGNVTLASDYRFRGISQLDGNVSPAIQGGFDSSFDNGIYVGTWASNVNLGTKASIEHDFYAGWANDSFDVGFIYYSYPRDDGQELDYLEIQGSFSFLDYYEVYGSIAWNNFTFGLNISPDYFAETDTFVYPYVGYGIDYDRYSFALHLGYNHFEEEDFLGNDDSYIDFSAGVTTEAWGAEWGLAIVGTDLDDDEDCFGDEDLCSVTLVASISKSL